MQKNIVPVLLSFFGVAIIVMLGTDIAYRKNVLSDLKTDFKKEQEQKSNTLQEKNAHILKLEEDLTIAIQKQTDAENKLKEKLAEEERIQLEKEQKEKAAQVAADKKAAEKARIAAEAAAKEASKKSKAS